MLQKLFKNLYLNEAIRISRKTKLFNLKINFSLVIYYFVTFINTVLEGIGLILIVSIFTGNQSLENSINDTFNVLMSYMGLDYNIQNLILLIIILFGIRLITYGSILLYDGYIKIYFKRSIQEKLFKNSLSVDWEIMRRQQVGNLANLNGEQSITAVKYFFSIIKTVYFFFTSLFLFLIIMLIDYKISLLLVISMLPIILIFQYFFSLQSKASINFAQERNKFIADITERLNNFLSIKVDGSEDYHYKKGIESQANQQKYEFRISFANSTN